MNTKISYMFSYKKICFYTLEILDEMANIFLYFWLYNDIARNRFDNK